MEPAAEGESTPPTPPPTEGESTAPPTPEPIDERPHRPKEALLLLAVSLLLAGAFQLLPREKGDWFFIGDFAPALLVCAWIVPAYAVAVRRKQDPFFIHALWGPPVRNLKPAIGVSVLILFAFALVFPIWAGWRGYGYAPSHSVPWVDVGANVVWGALFIALPEEYFFRGVLQPSLDSVGGPRHRLLGTPFGRGALLAAALFAVSHVLLPGFNLEPARLAVFFPALWFAWLRASTGSVLPALAFHALANGAQEVCFVAWGVKSMT